MDSTIHEVGILVLVHFIEGPLKILISQGTQDTYIGTDLLQKSKTLYFQVILRPQKYLFWHPGTTSVTIWLQNAPKIATEKCLRLCFSAKGAVNGLQ